jgi:membrane-bound serine protease (ClpP class)
MACFRSFYTLILTIVLGAGIIPAMAQKVVSITIDGAINPVAAEYIKSGIEKATKEKAECLIINLNTPGGLLKSTRVIVSDMLESEVPIVVYVSPSGAHAGSAGVFITLASHIAAMAPGTNMGSAHPVNLQGGMDSIMGEKTTNDAAAFIRSIAEKRGRNMEWAEDAVRFSVSLAETEAVKKNVVNIIAEDEADLLQQLNGWVVTMEDGEKTLNTETANTIAVEMTWVQKLLNYISDPNIAYILMLLGIYGIIFEFYNPGIGFPGVVGGISLILAFYAMHTLPINIAGLALIALAIILFILELATPTNGILGVGAVVSLFLGSIMLIKPGISFEWAKISLGVIIPAVIITTLFFLTIVGIGIRAQKNKVSTGIEGLLGEIGKALTDINPTGNVLVQGEIWSAKTKGEGIAKGSEVRVLEVHGLTITIEAVS